MDNLLDLARKFDAANTPELRKKLRAAIANSTAMEPADQESVDRLLALGDHVKSMLGERYPEFDERYSALIEKCPRFLWPARAALRQMSLAPGELALLAGDEIGYLSLASCGCASRDGMVFSECPFHLKESAS